MNKENPLPILMLPFTSSLCRGVVTPIPTFPFPVGLMRILSVLFVLKTNALLSLVPKKFVGGLVPALPVRLQLCAKDAVKKAEKKTTSIYFFINEIFVVVIKF